MNRKRSIELFFPPILILSIEFVLFYKVFLYTGYIQWGNFGFPLKANIFNSLNPLTWNPNIYDGIPTTSPWISFFGNLNSVGIIIVGGLWNLNLAIKLYIVLSTYFMTYSFYIMSASFSKSIVSRSIASIFILLNPLTLQFIGQGDFFVFTFWGFYFLSLAFLFFSMTTDGYRKAGCISLAVVFVSFTVGIPQLFYIGLPLFVIFMFYFSFFEKRVTIIEGFKHFLQNFMIYIPLIILLAMPLLLTTLYGAYNLSPNSAVANPLANFVTYSVNMFSLLRLDSFPGLSTTVLLGSTTTSFFKYLWSYLTIILVVSLIGGGIVLRDRRLLFMDLVVSIAIFLGSGYLSPISDFTVYLYTHMYGYQLLNASYYWEWLIIVPIYGIMISILIEDLFLIKKGEWPRNGKSIKLFQRRSVSKTLNKYVVVIMVALILFVILPPTLGQGFYGGGNTGIHPNNMPTSYNDLVKQVNGLVGNTNMGVAYFLPNKVVYFGNTSYNQAQPLLINPRVRSPGIPAYGAPLSNSNNFFYWIYREFYLNETHYLSQIMGLMGIKYFVTLNNVYPVSSLQIADSINSTKLMQYQQDVKLLFSSKDYSIFESTLNITLANKVNGFTLVSSNYNSLLKSAADGINLSRLAITFLGDISSSNFNFYLNNTTNLILLGNQSLTTLAIDKYINSNNSVLPVDFTNNYYDSTNAGWINSARLETSNNATILNSPSPFAITTTNKPLSVELKSPTNTSYALWAYIMRSETPGSKLQFEINGHISVINSTSILDTHENFAWIRLPTPSGETGYNVTLTSLNGTNGIERLALIRSGSVHSEINNLTNVINQRHIHVLYLDTTWANQAQNVSNINLSIAFTNLINEINDNSSISSLLNLTNNANGYVVSGNLTGISLVRYAYYSGIKQTSNGVGVLPTMGGLNFLLISHSERHQVSFVSVSYYPLLIGITAYVFVLASLIGWVVFTFIRIRRHTQEHKFNKNTRNH